MNGMNFRTLIYLLSYAFSTAFSVYLAMLSEQKWRPLPFSEFYLSNQEVLNIAMVLGSTTFIILLLGRLLANPQTNKRKFSLDYLNFLLAYTVAILYFLLASSITFNPNLFVYIGLYGSIFALILHLVFIKTSQGFFSELTQAITDLCKRFVSLYGVIVLLLFMTPMALAIGFIFSRDVADVITEIRLEFNKAENSKWGLVPAFESTNFRRPMIARFAMQDPNVLYVLERSGDLYQVDYPSGNNKKLVLDIKESVGLVDVENGALGLALHPQFSDINSANYHTIFIYYTSVHNNIQKNIISRFVLSSPPDSASSEEQLMVLERTNDAYHNGGSVDFGPDGFLYIALGEGVHTGIDHTPDKALRGAVLRIDIDKKGGDISQPIIAHPAHGQTMNYYIPKDNPFVGNDQALDEYWVLGLRNPFRISFDPKNGDLWAGDVGSTVWEEVNKIIKGSNYLYPYIEGPKTKDFVVPENLVGEPRHPNYTYKHSAFDRAVIGGVVYRGSALPELAGQYIFGDNFSGKLFGISANKAHSDKAQLIAQAEQYAQRGISSITYSPEGEVFVTLLGAKGQDTGQLMKLTTVDKAKENIATITVDEVAHNYSEIETNSLFLEMCSRCHGLDGKGHGPDSKLFDISIADFSSSSYSRSQEGIRKIITEGGVANQLSPYMPPWQAVLSDDEIKDLAIFIDNLNN
ncbi:PQQ-dependent sugar dehydrogenase [Colwelliaceae bacterium 6471]